MNKTVVWDGGQIHRELVLKPTTAVRIPTRKQMDAECHRTRAEYMDAADTMTRVREFNSDPTSPSFQAAKATYEAARNAFLRACTTLKERNPNQKDQ